MVEIKISRHVSGEGRYRLLAELLKISRRQVSRGIFVKIVQYGSEIFQQRFQSKPCRAGAAALLPPAAAAEKQLASEEGKRHSTGPEHSCLQ